MTLLEPHRAMLRTRIVEERINQSRIEGALRGAQGGLAN